MKILHLVTKRQYRGAEVFAANLSEELIKLGHEIIFVGLYKNDKEVLHVQDARNIDLMPTEIKSFSPRLVKKIVSLIKSTKPDIIQCNGSDTLKYMVAASFFLPRTPILYRNISMISRWLVRAPNRLVYRIFLKKIHHVSSVGVEAVEDFIKTCSYPRHKTSVIRRGIPVKNIDGECARKQLRGQLKLEEEDKIVMHIGNFSPEKNHLFLLDVFSKISDSNSHVKLICVGEGVLFKSIEDEIVARGLEKTVYLIGFRKDIPELLSAADCFVLPSFVEGVPGVILEAAVQKIPTVATNVGGVNEVLQNGVTGYTIDNFDQDDFMEKLLKILSDNELRRSMGQNAYRLAMEEFNPTKNAKKFEKLYKSLVLKKNVSQKII